MFAGPIHEPPIGLAPLWLHNEKRLNDINDAIERYRSQDYPIPETWINEKEHLVTLKRDHDTEIAKTQWQTESRLDNKMNIVIINNFVFACTKRFSVEMPVGATILGANSLKCKDGEELGVIWFCGDYNKKSETRTFVVIKTGEPFDFYGKKYIGTYQIVSVFCEYHVFEVI